MTESQSHNPTHPLHHLTLEEVLQRLSAMSPEPSMLPDRRTPIGQTTYEFFENNWQQAQDGVLAQSDHLRVTPLQQGPAPHEFRFEVDLPFKSKEGMKSVTLRPGPIRGAIRYRSDLYTAPADKPSIVVWIDRDLHLFHPNYSRRFGILCIGDIPTGPYPLDGLLLHTFSILSYQNWSATDPADLEAARYFATNPDALSGLLEVEPLY